MSGKCVVWKIDNDEHVAGLAYSAGGNKFMIKFTDGTQDYWTQDEVISKMVGKLGTKTFNFD